MTKVLHGHDAPETAYVVADYPYGFRLRCKIRYWIETSKRGQRMCSQTTNPKRPYEVWNAPKRSTYAAIQVMFLDEVGHVQHASLSAYASQEAIEASVERFGDAAFADSYRQRALKVLRAIHRVDRAATPSPTGPVRPQGSSDAREGARRKTERDEPNEAGT